MSAIDDEQEDDGTYEYFPDWNEEYEEIKFPSIEREGREYLQVCKSDEIFPKRGKNIFFDDEVQVAIFREEGRLYAVSNICPHQHAPVISEGYIEDCTVTCPLHGWIYSLESGKALGGHTRLKTYKVFEEEGKVYLEKPEPEVPSWAKGL